MKTTLKFIAFSIALWIVSNTTAHAQNLPYSNVCTQGAKNALTSGLPSSNLLLSSYTYCLVTVYNTGTTTPATIFSNASGSVLSNPFFASAITGQYTFYIAANSVVDITMSGGNPSPGITIPYTFSVALGGGGGSGGSCGTGTNLFLMIWTGASSCGASPIYTDATGNAVLNIPFSSSVNVYSPELNLFGTPGVAGAVAFSQGTSSAPGAGQVQISAPTSVTAYSLSLPPAQGTGNLYNPGNGILEWNSTLFQANGTALQNQNTINYVGAGNATVSNPSAGEVLISSTGSELSPYISVPSGNYILLYPTSTTGSASSSCVAYSATSGSVSFGSGAGDSLSVSGANCNTGGRTATATATGFALPSGVIASNVVGVSCVTLSGATAVGAVVSGNFSCGLSPYTTYATSPFGFQWGTIQETVGTSFAGTDIPNIGFTISGTGSACAAWLQPGCPTGVGPIPSNTIFGTVALLVQLSVTPPTPPSVISILPPLTTNGSDIGIAANAAFPGLNIQPAVIGTNLPYAVTEPIGTTYLVNNGSGTTGTSTDCSIGGGSAIVWCVAGSSSYTGYAFNGGGGGSGTVNSGTSGQVAYYAATGTAVSGETTVTPTQGGTGTGTAPTDAQILIGQSGGSYLPETASGSCTVSDTGVFSCSSGSPPFSAITSGANTTAAMVVGSGASLGASGSGTINATAENGVSCTGTPTTGQVCVATGSTTATWQTAGGVSSLTGDGALFNNAASTGAVTLSPSPAAPGFVYQSTITSGTNTSIIQSAVGVGNFSVTSTTVTLPSSTLAGDGIAIFATTQLGGSGLSTATISDTAGGTYNYVPLGGNASALYYLCNVTPGTHAITVTIPSASDLYLIAVEMSTVASGCLDSAVTNTITGVPAGPSYITGASAVSALDVIVAPILSASSCGGTSIAAGSGAFVEESYSGTFGCIGSLIVNNVSQSIATPFVNYSVGSSISGGTASIVAFKVSARSSPVPVEQALQIPVQSTDVATSAGYRPIAATSHTFAARVNCIAASGSATAYSCITTNVFTPASGDSVLLKVDVANTGSATLSVNGATAATITKTGGTVNLSGSELHVGQWLWMIFDGTNWQAQLTN